MKGETAEGRVVVVTWVEPTPEIRRRIAAEAPAAVVETWAWETVRAAPWAFLRRYYRTRVRALYFVARDLETSGRLPYLRLASLLLRARVRRLFDIEGGDWDSSPASALLRAIPRLLWELPLAAATLALNGLVVLLLSRRCVIRRLRVRPEAPPAPHSRELFFLWAMQPGRVINLRVGGEMSHVFGFLAGVRKLGLRPLLVTTRRTAHAGLAVENLVVDERRLPAWPGEIRDMAYNGKALWRLLPVLRARHPELIYHRSTAFSYTGVLLSVLGRVPLVVEFNSSDVWESGVAGRTRWRGLLARTERLSFEYAAAVAVVSDQVKEQFARRGFDLARLVVNPNGVDPEFFVPSRRPRKQVAGYDFAGRFLVGFVGVFLPYHGVLTLARAVAPVIAQWPQAHFLVVGDGPLRGDLEQILRESGMHEHVTITGKVPHEQVPAFLDACDALVSPHQHMMDGSPFFGSPTKIFEYLSMGKPIVASRVGQLEQILRHEEHALLVPPEDPRALAEAILRLAADTGLCAALGARARELVQSRYTWEQNARRILAPVLGAVN